MGIVLAYGLPLWHCSHNAFHETINVIRSLQLKRIPISMQVDCIIVECVLFLSFVALQNLFHFLKKRKKKREKRNLKRCQNNNKVFFECFNGYDLCLHNSWIMLMILHELYTWLSFISYSLHSLYIELMNIQFLACKIPCGILAKLGNFGHIWRNHFFLKMKCQNWEQ